MYVLFFLEQIRKTVQIDLGTREFHSIDDRISYKTAPIADIIGNSGLRPEFIAVADSDMTCETALAAYSIV